jgi:hypothetical protein
MRYRSRLIPLFAFLYLFFYMQSCASKSDLNSPVVSHTEDKMKKDPLKKILPLDYDLTNDHSIAYTKDFVGDVADSGYNFIARTVDTTIELSGKASLQKLIAPCGSDEFAIGGGYFISQNLFNRIQGFAPIVTESHSVFQTTGYFKQGQGGVAAFSNCVNNSIPPGSKITVAYSDEIPLSPNTCTNFKVECDSGDILLSGGYLLDDATATDVIINIFYPEMEDKNFDRPWQYNGTACMEDDQTTDITATALCLTPPAIPE